MWERVPNIAEVCEHSDSIIESKKLFHRCGQTNDILLSQNSSSGITSQIVWKTFDLNNNKEYEEYNQKICFILSKGKAIRDV